MANKLNIPIEIEGDEFLLFSGKIMRKSGALAFCGPLTQFFLTVAMGKMVWLQKVGEHEEVSIGVKAKNVRIVDLPSNDSVRFSGDVEKNFVHEPVNCIAIRIGNNRVIIPSERAGGFKEGEVVSLQFSRTDATLFRCPPDGIDQALRTFVLSPG